MALQRARRVAAIPAWLDGDRMERLRHFLRHGLGRPRGRDRLVAKEHAPRTVEKSGGHDGSLQCGWNTNHEGRHPGVNGVTETHLPGPMGKPTLSA